MTILLLMPISDSFKFAIVFCFKDEFRKFKLNIKTFNFYIYNLFYNTFCENYDQHIKYSAYGNLGLY